MRIAEISTMSSGRDVTAVVTVNPVTPLGHPVAAMTPRPACPMTHPVTPTTSPSAAKVNHRRESGPLCSCSSSSSRVSRVRIGVHIGA